MTPYIADRDDDHVMARPTLAHICVSESCNDSGGRPGPAPVSPSLTRRFYRRELRHFWTIFGADSPTSRTQQVRAVGQDPLPIPPLPRSSCHTDTSVEAYGLAVEIRVGNYVLN